MYIDVFGQVVRIPDVPATSYVGKNPDDVSHGTCRYVPVRTVTNINQVS